MKKLTTKSERKSPKVAIKGLFSLDAIEGKKFPGYTFGDDWNGWATPYFESEEANEIGHALGGKKGYDKPPYFMFPEEGPGSDLSDGPYKQEKIQTVDGEKMVYPIGAYHWIWENDLMKNGGGITGARAAELAKIYSTGTAKQLWETWIPQERTHFLIDHATEFFELMGDDFKKSSNSFAILTYDTLPTPIRKSVIIHHAMGMYNDGGSMSGGGEADSYKKEMALINERQLNSTLKEIKQAIKNKKTWELYDQYEDDNYHSENTILLAQTVGNEKDKQDTLDIWRAHAMAGSIPDDVYQKRNLLSKKLWPKFVENAIATEGIKMAEGGEYQKREGGTIKKYNEGAEISSKLSPAKQKLLGRINTLNATKANAGAAAQKSIQKKIDVLQKQFDYNPSSKQKAQANKGKFAMDVPGAYSKGIYKKLWSMKIFPRIHKLNGTASIIVNSQINLDKAYKVYYNMLKDKKETVPSLSKISRKL